MPNTGNTFAGFLLGSVRQATFNQDLASWLPRSSIHSFYFQDDWKVTPTLTANLGVRYSNESPFNTKWKQMSNFDPNFTDPVTGGRGGIAHPTSGLNKRDNNNFQPRIGLAWHPWQKWVFRGGFAVNTVRGIHRDQQSGPRSRRSAADLSDQPRAESGELPHAAAAGSTMCSAAMTSPGFRRSKVAIR